MTADELHERIRRHNAVHLTMGILALAAAPLAWYVSFWLFRLLFFMATHWFLEDRAAEVSSWIAVVGIGLLVLEGMREGRELFSLEEFRGRGSVFVYGRLAPYAARVRFGAFVCSNILAFAPQLTLAGIRLVRSRLSAGRFTIDVGVRIYNDLAAHREWVDAAGYPGGERAAALLHALRLIWVEGGEDEEAPLRMRIPAGEGKTPAPVGPI